MEVYLFKLLKTILGMYGHIQNKVIAEIGMITWHLQGTVQFVRKRFLQLHGKTLFSIRIHNRRS